MFVQLLPSLLVNVCLQFASCSRRRVQVISAFTYAVQTDQEWQASSNNLTFLLNQQQVALATTIYIHQSQAESNRGNPDTQEILLITHRQVLLAEQTNSGSISVLRICLRLVLLTDVLR